MLLVISRKLRRKNEWHRVTFLYWPSSARISTSALSPCTARPAPTPHATSTPRQPGRSHHARIAARRPSPALERRRLPSPPAHAASQSLLARQTLRMARHPADRTARATCPACFAAPAPRQPEPATHAPRLASAPATDVGLSRRPQGLAEPQHVLRGLGASPSGSLQLRSLSNRTVQRFTCHKPQVF